DGLVTLFRVLRHPLLFRIFQRKVALTPYARSEFMECRDSWQDCEGVEKAYRFFVAARMSFGGTLSSKSWSRAITESARGMSSTVSKWLSTVDSLPEIHERLRRVQVEKKDFREIIRDYDTPETFFYLDPPYHPETRRRARIYTHEMSTEDYEDLVDILLTIKGKALLSGYRHPVYERLEDAGWGRIDFDVPDSGPNVRTHTSVRRRAIESVWHSYPLAGGVSGVTDYDDPTATSLQGGSDVP